MHFFSIFLEADDFNDLLKMLIASFGFVPSVDGGADGGPNTSHDGDV